MESETEEGLSGSRKAKAVRWFRGCWNYRFPASIDPFTSEIPEQHTTLRVLATRLSCGVKFSEITHK